MQSSRQSIFTISFVLIALLCVVAYFIRGVISAFEHNMPINITISLLVLFGILLVYRNIFNFDNEYSLLIRFSNLNESEIRKLKILKPLTFYITKNNNTISQAKLQTILGGIDKRIGDSESFIKYISGILITFGLLGTFGGLSVAIGGVSKTINNLGVVGGGNTAMGQLNDSLNIVLAGMGNAFGCSLFAICGAVVLGFIFTRQKNVSDELFNYAEEWLSKNTISFDVIDNMQEYHGTIFSMGLLEKTIETIYAFQNHMKSLDEYKESIFHTQKEISTRLDRLTDIMSVQQDAINVLSKNQLEMQQIIIKLSHVDNVGTQFKILDGLASIDRSIQVLISNGSHDKKFIVDALGKDIRMVSKTLSSLME